MESGLAEKQLKQAQNKVDEINRTVKNLYSEKMKGKMPDTFFYSMLADYEKELDSIQKRIEVLNKQIKFEASVNISADKFVKMATKYLKVEKLDFYLAHELIETITVSEFYLVDGKRTQDITIKYKFVGDLSALLGKNKDAA